MHSRSLFSVALWGLAAFAAAPAAAEGVILEAAVGSSKLTSDDSTLEDRATAIGIVGRWGGGKGLGMEAGVRGHGEWAVNDAAGTYRFAVTSLLAGVTYDIPMGPVTLGARVGGHAWRVNGQVIGVGSTVLTKTEDSGAGLYYSLGASYAVSERMSIGTYYNVFNLEDGIRVKSVDVRLSYAF